MSRIESTDMSNEQAVATHTALMLGQKQAIYRGSKDGLRVYYLAGEKYPDPDRKEEATFFVVDEETGKYAVMTHADLRHERQERQNGVIHAELGEDSDYLEHYGIKGMKWGIRRFQNKDGSLTKAGLKRYSDAASNTASKVGKAVGKAAVEGGKKLGEAAGKAAQVAKEKISEKHAQRKEEKRIEKLMSKPIRKLTEEERLERMDRKMKEKELRTLEKNVKDLSDGAMSKGRKFVEDMVTKVAVPAVLNAGEKQLTAFLNKKLGDALGLGEKDSTVVSDLLSGKKTFMDLTDKEFNTVGKAGEGAGSFIKNILGKNPDQNEGPDSTVFRDLLSGKLKTSDATDGELGKGKKGAEAVDAIEKVRKKLQLETDYVSTSESKPKSETKSNSESTSTSESKPKTEPKTEPKSNSESKPKTRSELGDYKMKSVEEMSSYTPVKSGKSQLSKLYDSGYSMRSVEDIEASSSIGFGRSTVLHELYSSGYRMAPMNDK